MRCRFEIRPNINVYNYTLEGFQAHQSSLATPGTTPAGGEEEGSEGKGGDDVVSDNTADLQQPPSDHTVEDYEYELVGVVVHSGTAQRGHYWSYVKSRVRDPDTGKGGRLPSGSWIRFDDSAVSIIDMTPDVLARECFGGEIEVPEVTTYGTTYMSKMESEQNAYLLVYERKHKDITPPPPAIVPKPLLGPILAENAAFTAERQAYSRPLAQYLTGVYQHLAELAKSNGVDGMLGAVPSDVDEILQWGLRYFFLVLCRTKLTAEVTKLGDALSTLLASDKRLLRGGLIDTVEVSLASLAMVVMCLRFECD